MRPMLAAILATACSGCANGVSMNDEERVACRTNGCIVMTEAELRDFGSKVGSEAYRKGWTDAHKQGGKEL
jgi:hypothetical protein